MHSSSIAQLTFIKIRDEKNPFEEPIANAICPQKVKDYLSSKIFICFCKILRKKFGAESYGVQIRVFVSKLEDIFKILTLHWIG